MFTWVTLKGHFSPAFPLFSSLEGNPLALAVSGRVSLAYSREPPTVAETPPKQLPQRHHRTLSLPANNLLSKLLSWLLNSPLPAAVVCLPHALPPQTTETCTVDLRTTWSVQGPSTTPIRPTQACGQAGGPPPRPASRRRRWCREWWPPPRTWPTPRPSRRPSPNRRPTRPPPPQLSPPLTRLSPRASCSPIRRPARRPRTSCTTASTCPTPTPPSPPVLVSCSLFSDHFLLIAPPLKTKLRRGEWKNQANNLCLTACTVSLANVFPHLHLTKYPTSCCRAPTGRFSHAKFSHKKCNQTRFVWTFSTKSTTVGLGTLLAPVWLLAPTPQYRLDTLGVRFTPVTGLLVHVLAFQEEVSLRSLLWRCKTWSLPCSLPASLTLQLRRIQVQNQLWSGLSMSGKQSRFDTKNSSKTTLQVWLQVTTTRRARTPSTRTTRARSPTQITELLLPADSSPSSSIQCPLDTQANECVDVSEFYLSLLDWFYIYMWPFMWYLLYILLVGARVLNFV